MQQETYNNRIMKQIYKSLFCVLGLLLPTASMMAQVSDLQREINEMSYAMGLAQTQGLDEYLTNSMEIDLAYKDSFIKGIVEGAERANDPESAAYYCGIHIGVQICTQMTKAINKQLFGENSQESISIKDFLNGFIIGVKGVSDETLKEASETATEKLQKVKAIMLEKELYGK